ncbi:hypothetical protein ACFFX0_03240 [Citricoccus parietis]|uniref:Uncharacterized protein n=1 Tax=Citricoccus parietis TaxID=592307 RepID=A0ABV5FUA1_9MICC
MTTVTPVANWPKVWRSARGSKDGPSWASTDSTALSTMASPSVFSVRESPRSNRSVGDSRTVC